jgi:hypothetical protein
MPPMLPLPDNARNYLESLAAGVHGAYFWKVPPLPVRWGQQISRKRRRSIRLGSYNHVTTEIRIHPLLRGANVPAYVIESIIHHEYLHHVLGPHHNRRFHANERKFRYFRESQEWIRRHLFLLLGRKRSELRPRRAAPPAAEAPRVQLALF